MLNNILHYSKSILAFIGTTLTFALTLPALGLPVWVGAIAALCTFISVYAVPNQPKENTIEYQPRHALEEKESDDKLF